MTRSIPPEPLPAPAVQVSPTADGLPLGEVQELGPHSHGRWVVRTRGSRHLFDLDAGTYRRSPEPGHGRFAHDGHTVRLTRVERWPRLGHTFFVWVDDPNLPDLIEHWHQSSTIRSITQAPDEAAGG